MLAGTFSAKRQSGECAAQIWNRVGALVAFRCLFGTCAGEVLWEPIMNQISLVIQRNWSWRGLVVVVVFLLPSILLAFFPPVDILSIEDSLLLAIVENVGRIAVIVTLLFSANDFERRANIWLVTAGLFALLYYVGWVRYFYFGREYQLLYAPMWFVPVPLAVFPVLALAFVAIWSRSLNIGIATLIMAIGHVSQSYLIYREIIIG